MVDMMLIRAKDLRGKFEIMAQFYKENVANETFLMRREAQIVRIGTSQETKANAVIVMLNPGSCKPASEIGNGLLSEMTWTYANPDPTQYQLMRLMERMEWNKLTIVNLSDICEGNSTKFLAIEKKFKAAELSHSIFQLENGNDPNELILNADELIFAWGERTLAKRLAKEFGLYDGCKVIAPYCHMKAVIYSPSCYPRHPKPLKEIDRIKWLDTITPLLKIVNTHA